MRLNYLKVSDINQEEQKTRSTVGVGDVCRKQKREKCETNQNDNRI